jgi:hypothetical protein
MPRRPDVVQEETPIFIRTPEDGAGQPQQQPQELPARHEPGLATRRAMHNNGQAQQRQTVSKD